MATPQLQKARQLIEAKRYDEARRILQGLGDNPTAQRWLAKLDSLLLEQSQDSLNRVHPIQRAPTHLYVIISILSVLVLGLTVLVAILLLRNTSATIAQSPPLPTQTATEEVVADNTEQIRAVTVACLRLMEATEQECQQLANKAMSRYSTEVNYCFQQYVEEADIFNQCLQERVLTDMEQVIDYHRGLYTGCTFKYRSDLEEVEFEFEYSLEVGESCYLWAWSDELMSNSTYREQIDACWAENNPFDLWGEGRTGEIIEVMPYSQKFAECVSATVVPMPTFGT